MPTITRLLDCYRCRSTQRWKLTPTKRFHGGGANVRRSDRNFHNIKYLKQNKQRAGGSTLKFICDLRSHIKNQPAEQNENVKGNKNTPSPTYCNSKSRFTQNTKKLFVNENDNLLKRIRNWNDHSKYFHCLKVKNFFVLSVNLKIKTELISWIKCEMKNLVVDV